MRDDYFSMMIVSPTNCHSNVAFFVSLSAPPSDIGMRQECPAALHSQWEQ